MARAERTMNDRAYIAAHLDVPLSAARAVLESQGIPGGTASMTTLLEVRARLRLAEADALLRALAEDDASKAEDPEDYRYRCTLMGATSAKYGPCEVCGEHADEVYRQVEQRRKPNGGWTGHGCRELFGHEECLIAQRKNQQEIPE